MERRKFEKIGIETGLLGFGCMRFPVMANGEIDEATAEQMLTEAYEAGVNYFDTAYVYHNQKSEGFVGRVLKKLDRDSFYIATKLPVWNVEKKGDVRRIFDEQRRRLGMDHVDFYLLHSLNKEHWGQVKKYNIIETCEELRKEGKIRYFGFSFHDAYELFEEIIKSHAWDFCQIQYNYLDTYIQAGDKGYALAERMGIPVIVMEPIRGGSLANFSEDINEKFRAINPNASIASFALRWVASHPDVKVVLSGMSSLEQLRDNLDTFGNYRPFSRGEQAAIDDVILTIRGRIQNGCTGCRYCMPCPFGVNIPANFKAWNDYHVFQSYTPQVRHAWEHELTDGSRARNCTKCGHCEPLCPQQLHIRDDLERVQKDLEGISDIR